MRAEPLSTATYDHGEGVRWDAARGELLWVDITAGRFLRAGLDHVDDPVVHEAGVPVGAVTPVSGGGWLLAAGRGLRTPSGTVLHELEPEDVRMNDAACDPAGRFWAGSMAYNAREGAGSLHRLDVDGSVTTVLSGLTISNGLGWSPDGRTMYLNDSGPSVTWAFTYDADTGDIADRRQLVHHEDGAGDGLAVDDDGCLWVPLFGGAAVDRYDPDGRRMSRVDIPAQQPTDCCLVDGRLVVTTARRDLASAGWGDGRLFVVDVGVSGPPVTPYGGAVPA